MTPVIAVFGSGANREDDVLRARALGVGLARAGFEIINGGYGGTMAASAEGARSAGGRATGVTCALFGPASVANPHLDRVVEAPTLLARLDQLVTTADGYIVLPGGSGTLVELALVWEHARKGLSGQKPIVAWEDPWRPILEALGRGPHLDGGVDRIVWVEDVDAAVDAVRRALPQ